MTNIPINFRHRTHRSPLSYTDCYQMGRAYLINAHDTKRFYAADDPFVIKRILDKEFVKTPLIKFRSHA